MKKEKAAQPVAEVTTPAAPDPINRIPEAARILGCNEQTLADKLRKGEIKGKKRFGHWFTTHSNLLAYVAE